MDLDPDPWVHLITDPADPGPQRMTVTTSPLAACTDLVSDKYLRYGNVPYWIQPANVVKAPIGNRHQKVGHLSIYP